MSLDRNTVSRATAEHIRHLERHGPLSERQKREIRRMHERIARKVEARNG